MRRALLPLMMILIGCDRPKGSPDDVVLNAEELEIVAGNPGLKKECLRGAEMLWINNPDCFEMAPAQRWKGLWRAGWEWTNFCPEPAKDCSSSAEHGDIWLDFAEGAYKGPKLVDGLYQIEFVGRRTKVPGHFGHLSQYDHLMVADRVISVGLLKADQEE